MVNELTSKIDELGMIRAKIADLRAREKDLAGDIEKLLEDASETEAKGTFFQVNLIKSIRKSVDWKTIAERLKPSRQLIRAHTNYREVVSVRISAKKMEAA